MTQEQLRDYATTLAQVQVADIEFLTVVELAEGHCPGGTISDKDAATVCELLDRVTITVSFTE